MKKAVPWLKSHSTPATLKWIDLNYQPADGICIPRNSLYKEYVEFCRINQMQPVNAASFGKIIRQKFPTLTTRRLGMRGQSKYHYYGLTVKLKSISYARTDRSYEPQNPSADLHFSSDFKSLNLPPLPSRDIIAGLGPGTLRDNLETVLDTYVSHCKRVADHAFHFHHTRMCQEISNFWGEYLSVFSTLLENNSVLSLLGACDSILFHGISQNLLPRVMWHGFRKSFDNGLLFNWEKALRLAETAHSFTSFAVESGPNIFKCLKTSVTRNFFLNIQSQASLSSTCTELLADLVQDGRLEQIKSDWIKVDTVSVSREVLPLNYISNCTLETNLQSLIVSSLSEFPELLNVRSGVDATTDGFDDIMKNIMSWSNRLTGSILRHFSSSSSGNPNDEIHKKKVKLGKREIIEEANQMWIALSASILRQLYLKESSSYGTFEKITLLLTKYAEQLLQSLISSELIRRLLENVSSGKSLEEVEPYLCRLGQGFPVQFKNPITSEKSESQRSSPTCKTESVVINGDNSICDSNFDDAILGSCQLGFSYYNPNGEGYIKNYPEQPSSQNVASMYTNCTFQIPEREEGEIDTSAINGSIIVQPLPMNSIQPLPILLQEPMATESFEMIHNILSFDDEDAISVNRMRMESIDNSQIPNCRMQQEQIQPIQHSFSNANGQCQQVVPDLNSLAMSMSTESRALSQNHINGTLYDLYNPNELAEQAYPMMSSYPHALY